MKPREQFIEDIYRKSEARKQKEAKKRKQIRRLSAGGMSLAACLILVFGVAGFADDFSSQNSTGTEKALCQEQTAPKDSDGVQMYSGDEKDQDIMYSEDAATNETSKNQNSAGNSNSDGTLNDSTGGSDSADSSFFDHDDENGKSTAKSRYEAETGGQKGSVKEETRKSGTASTGEGVSEQNTHGGDSVSSQMPARMIRIEDDGSRTEIDEEEMTTILQKILQLEKEQKAVYRHLGEPEPKKEYTTKILFVLYDSESKTALEEDDPQNVVWYLSNE